MRNLGAFILIVVLGAAIGGLIKATWPKKQPLISHTADWYKKYPGCDPKKVDPWYKCFPEAK